MCTVYYINQVNLDRNTDLSCTYKAMFRQDFKPHIEYSDDVIGFQQEPSPLAIEKQEVNVLWTRL